MKIIIIILCTLLLLLGCSSIQYTYEQPNIVEYEINNAEAKLILIGTLFFGSMLYEFNR